MQEKLQHCELFSGLDVGDLERLSKIAGEQTVPAGEYLFLLGENADRLFVVLSGKIELCFPLSIGGTMKDIAVETKNLNDILGWSALVKPYRFTLSARAVEPCRLATFPRRELRRVFDANCSLGYAIQQRITEVVGHRLLQIQALWARGIQRTLSELKDAPGTERRQTPESGD